MNGMFGYNDKKQNLISVPYRALCSHNGMSALGLTCHWMHYTFPLSFLSKQRKKKGQRFPSTWTLVYVQITTLSIGNMLKSLESVTVILKFV